MMYGDNVDFHAAFAVGIAVAYLEQLLMADTVLPVSEFSYLKDFDQAKKSSSYMVIDAQAIEHLELLEVPGKTQRIQEGSFYSFISKPCSTSFGKRLLKRWIVAPLKDPVKINQRLDAVTDLVTEFPCKDKLQAKLRKLPDIERLLSRIYTYSAK
jgi:DNA mismatch repair protein MSH6